MTTVIKQIVGDNTQVIRQIVQDSERGPAGPQGIPGGTIQYSAGIGIAISDQNVISATGTVSTAWGAITGTLSNQTDLQDALNSKANTSAIPTVNNATITFTNNGSTVDSFTTNASSAKTIALAAPVITMQTTDPGEGVALAANNFIAVYSE